MERKEGKEKRATEYGEGRFLYYQYGGSKSDFTTPNL